MDAFGLAAISQDECMIIRWNFTSIRRHIFCTEW